MPDSPTTLLIAALLPVLGGLGWMLGSHAWFALYHRHKGIELPPLGLGGFLRYHLREGQAFIGLGWWHLRARFRDALTRPAGPITGPPVLCVHGFTQNGTNFWGIRRILLELGRPSRAVSMGPPPRRLEDYAERLEAALVELVTEFPDELIDVVAHSMGGVVLRVVLDRNAALRDVLGRVVTLGSPHFGTAGGRGVPIGWEVGQMKRRSGFLMALPDFGALAPRAVVTTIAAERDFVVYPASTSHLPGAHHAALRGVGHAGLLWHREAVECAVAALHAPITAERVAATR